MSGVARGGKEVRLAPFGFRLQALYWWRNILHNADITLRTALRLQTPQRPYRHHSESPDTTANLQTPQRPFRHHSESQDTTANLQTPQRPFRHHSKSPDTTANLQTPQRHLRRHSESPDTTMTLQATTWISRHHNDTSGNKVNLQTPRRHFRQQGESPDTTTLQATKWISRHHNDTSGNKVNLQTPQRHFRHHSESPDNTTTLQVPQLISRHNNAIEMNLRWCYFYCHYPFLASNARSENITVGHIAPSVRPTSIFSSIRRHFVLSVVHKQVRALHQGCTNPERTYFELLRKVFVGPQYAPCFMSHF
jgi:hypothetical protein